MKKDYKAYRGTPTMMLADVENEHIVRDLAIAVDNALHFAPDKNRIAVAFTRKQLEYVKAFFWKEIKNLNNLR